MPFSRWLPHHATSTYALHALRVVWHADIRAAREIGLGKGGSALSREGRRVVVHATAGRESGGGARWMP